MVQTFVKDVRKDIILPMSPGPGRLLMANLLRKFIFRTDIYVTITDADIRSLKFLRTGLICVNCVVLLNLTKNHAN